MALVDYLRLVVLGLWLLDAGVTCENTKKGYVLRVQAGRHQTAHSDEGWNGKSVFRRPTTGYKPSGLQGGTDSKRQLVPETGNVPKSQVGYFKPGFTAVSVPRGQGGGRRAVFFPDGSRQRPSVISPVRTHQARAKPRDGFPTRQDTSLTRSGGNCYKPVYALNGWRGSGSAGKLDSYVSYPGRSPRGHGGSSVLHPRGYTHVRHLRPCVDKTQQQAGGTVAPGTSERQPRLNYESVGKQHSNWNSLQLERATNPVQGKFKPFQRVFSDEHLVHNHTEGETAPTQATTQSVAPSAIGELSTEAASPMQTEGLNVELGPQESTPREPV